MTPQAIRPLLGTGDPSRTYQPRPGAYAIITNSSGELLTLETGTGVFLPGGGQDPDESLDKTLVREVFEELGVTVQRVQYLLAADDCRYSPLYQQHFHIQSHYFCAQILTFDTFVTEPKARAVWRSLAEAAKQLTRSNDRWLVGMLQGDFQIQRDADLDYTALIAMPGSKVWVSDGVDLAFGVTGPDRPSVPVYPTATFLTYRNNSLVAAIRLSLLPTHYQVVAYAIGKAASSVELAVQLQSQFTDIKFVDPSGVLAFND